MNFKWGLNYIDGVQVLGSLSSYKCTKVADAPHCQSGGPHRMDPVSLAYGSNFHVRQHSGA